MPWSRHPAESSKHTRARAEVIGPKASWRCPSETVVAVSRRRSARIPSAILDLLARFRRCRARLALAHELDLLAQRLARFLRRLVRVQAEEIPRFALQAPLPHVPPAFGRALERERDAAPRLVLPLVAFERADFVQHAAFVVEDAPVLHDRERGQALLQTLREVA